MNASFVLCTERQEIQRSRDLEEGGGAKYRNTVYMWSTSYPAQHCTSLDPSIPSSAHTHTGARSDHRPSLSERRARRCVESKVAAAPAQCRPRHCTATHPPATKTTSQHRVARSACARARFRPSGGPPPTFERHTCCSCLGLKRAPEGRQRRAWGDGLRVLLRMNVCARLRATRQKAQTTQRAGRIS